MLFMLGKDGLDTIKELRALNPSFRVIVMSAAAPSIRPMSSE
jgi:DNA-binding NarL/FixJ family response regulator